LDGEAMARLRKPRFTNDPVVYELLKTEARPLSAYQIMERLRPAGICSPMTVYRSLARLIGTGHVHRIESLNAYVVAIDPKTEASSLYAVCRQCGDTEQVYDQTLAMQLRTWALTHNFEVEQVSFELKGCCHACARSAGKTFECTA
jgi:Fur family zinc uptake transcriptional regulator